MPARKRTTIKKKVTRKGRDSKGRFLKGFYQPCTKGSRIKKSMK